MNNISWLEAIGGCALILGGGTIFWYFLVWMCAFFDMKDHRDMVARFFAGQSHHSIVMDYSEIRDAIKQLDCRIDNLKNDLRMANDRYAATLMAIDRKISKKRAKK